MNNDMSSKGTDPGLDIVCRFAGHLSHDLNNLLTPVVACGQMLTDSMAPDDPMFFCAEQIADAAKRMITLSKKLQMIGSRRSAGLALDPSTLVHDAIHALNLPPSPPVTIKADLDSLSPEKRMIRADPEQFLFMANELIRNAMAAMPPANGTINIALTTDTEIDGEPAPSGAGWIVLTVEDNGSGMDDDVMAHMYEPFVTTHGQARDKGIGLTIVYGIARRFNARLSCSSTPGSGTTFRIAFPALPPHE